MEVEDRTEIDPRVAEVVATLRAFGEYWEHGGGAVGGFMASKVRGLAGVFELKNSLTVTPGTCACPDCQVKARDGGPS